MAGVVLSLNPQEANALQSLLDDDLPELSREISHTDDYDFKQWLKARRDVLDDIRIQLCERRTADPGVTHQDL